MGVNFHLAEISIQPTEALLFYIQIGSSVHLHSIKPCYSSVFIRSVLSGRTENVCDIRQLDSICLFSAEMEFQRLHPICCHTLSRHEKLSVKFGQSDGKKQYLFCTSQLFPYLHKSGILLVLACMMYCCTVSQLSY